MVKYEFISIMTGICTVVVGSALAVPSRSAPVHR